MLYCTLIALSVVGLQPKGQTYGELFDLKRSIPIYSIGEDITLGGYLRRLADPSTGLEQTGGVDLIAFRVLADPDGKGRQLQVWLQDDDGMMGRWLNENSGLMLFEESTAWSIKAKSALPAFPGMDRVTAWPRVCGSNIRDYFIMIPADAEYKVGSSMDFFSGFAKSRRSDPERVDARIRSMVGADIIRRSLQEREAVKGKDVQSTAQPQPQPPAQLQPTATWAIGGVAVGFGIANGLWLCFGRPKTRPADSPQQPA